ncbi:hypothetical protein MJO29_004165 [Puccinia striiformis f. sp. tritici]|uniref:Uncharacterized protein n=2 Tax=Puccinia striiformis TaxID=27350 RepID=A0A0L0VP98_9BASI|nr:hypothetical protein MJO29_004165 [Puccinia striiformis f. sp. tritici]KNF01108.1 hypothetical protein PSTG_05737 [Puccinia striiformis f. sp. tritici PST-78]POW12077.1 hypothetical protein PSTT_04845 [Puccinia striiformis]
MATQSSIDAAGVNVLVELSFTAPRAKRGAAFGSSTKKQKNNLEGPSIRIFPTPRLFPVHQSPIFHRLQKELVEGRWYPHSHEPFQSTTQQTSQIDAPRGPSGIHPKNHHVYGLGRHFSGSFLLPSGKDADPNESLVCLMGESKG